MAAYQKGLYRWRITNQGFCEASTGKPGFFIQGEPQAFINAQGIEEPCDSYPRTKTWWLSDNTVDWVLGDLGRLGFEGDSFAELDPDQDDFCNLAGHEVVMYCNHRPGNDDPMKMYEDWALPQEKMAAKPVQENVSEIAAKLDKQFGKAFTKRVARKAADAAATVAAAKTAEKIGSTPKATRAAVSTAVASGSGKMAQGDSPF